MASDPKLEVSKLSQSIQSSGKAVDVQIYRLEGEEKWILEIVDEFNNSTVWEETFSTDWQALTEAKKAILEETIGSFIGPEDGKTQGEWR
jgi:uncharacterized protein